MHFNTQIVYLLGTESVTGAVIAMAIILILGIIHKFCPGFSHRQEIGWMGIFTFLFPVWYIVRWIVKVWLPGQLYGAIVDPIGIFFGPDTEKKAGIVLAIWGGGVLCGIAFLLVKHVQLRRTIKEAKRVTDPDILYTLEELQESLGICRNITLLYHEKLPSPGCAGIWKPYIVINQSAMNREYIYSVLCHELIHIKKNDILLRYLINLVSVIHWFNPMVHVFRMVMTRQMEYGCDTYAILRTGWLICPDDYIASISKVIKKNKKRANYVLAFGGKHEYTKKRTHYLKKVTTPRFMVSSLVLMVSCGIFLGASFTAYAANKTLTNSYETWLQVNTEDPVCEGQGEAGAIIESEYRTKEEIIEEERDITIGVGLMGVSWKLSEGEKAISKTFEGFAGDVLRTIITGDADFTYEVGLFQPDGEVRWIHVEEFGYHEFELKQNGMYRLAVKNNQNTVSKIDVTMLSVLRSNGEEYIEIIEE